MPVCALLQGGPGGGKTTEQLEIMSKILKTDVKDPMQIGFITFTRAARREASSRAAEMFGMSSEKLEKDGWFRTVHAYCYRALRVASDQLLTDDAASRTWLQSVFQEPTYITREGTDGQYRTCGEQATPAGEALALWDLARNRLERVAATHERLASAGAALPVLEKCVEYITLYESAKQEKNRLDFVDLLLRVAGFTCSVGGVDAANPQGLLPDLPALFVDEAQDNSWLMDIVCQRIAARCRWVYVAADEDQAIHSWAGADPTAFLHWPYVKRRRLTKSHRCPAEHLEAARRILARDERWTPYDFAPRTDEGPLNVLDRNSVRHITEHVDPSRNTLILCRTHYLAGQLAAKMLPAGIPWQPTKGRGGFNAPARVQAILSLRHLQLGFEISGKAWSNILQFLPSKKDNQELLVRGTKTRYIATTKPSQRLVSDNASESQSNGRSAEEAELLPVRLANLEHAGGTAYLQGILGAGAWTHLLENADAIIDAVNRHGESLVQNPRVRIGTIHSAKGMEADDVVLYTELGSRIAGAVKNNDENLREERRVWYVGMTRAKEKLTVVRNRKGSHFDVTD